jgi:hypothetical protein
MAEYSGVAREKGLTSREVEAVQSIVMAVAGGRVRAQFKEARQRQRVPSKEVE